MPRPRYLSLVPVAALALCVVAAADAILGITYTLPQQVRISITEPPDSPIGLGGLDILHACFQYSDTIRGFQIGLAALLFGGIPAAILAAALRAAGRHRTSRHWSGEWSNIFAAGVVFQLCSFAFTALLLVLTLAVVVTDPQVTFIAVTPAIGVLLLSSTGSLWGLRSWRTLQATAHQEPLHITAR